MCANIWRTPIRNSFYRAAFTRLQLYDATFSGNVELAQESAGIHPFSFALSNLHFPHAILS
jgi:hypothetical protein